MFTYFNTKSSSSSHHHHVHSHRILATLLFTLNQECLCQVQPSYLLPTYYSRWRMGKTRKTNTIFQYPQTPFSLQWKIVQAALRSATLASSKTLPKWLNVPPRSSSWLEINRLRYPRHSHRTYSFKLTHQGHSHADLQRKWQQDHIKSFRSLTRSAHILKSFSTSQLNTWIQLICSHSTRSPAASTTWSTHDIQRT